jgi:hypothetical protein
MPSIDLTDEELAGVTAAIKRAVENDRFPLAPRLGPLRSATATAAAKNARAGIREPATPKGRPRAS